MSISLWPPLAQIRRSLQAPQDRSRDDAPSRQSGTGAAPSSDRAADDLTGPLQDLARRRAALARRDFDARWEPGRLVGVRHRNLLLGVLLDQREGIGPGAHWLGWLATGEADWASAFDVLLEPQDEPFDPAYGVVQVWNRVRLPQSPRGQAPVLGEISATRLAALRAVQDQWLASTPPGALPDSMPEPGVIALREVAGVFTVLTGTALAAQDDPRAEYQALYRALAQEFCAAVAASPAPAPSARADAAVEWGARLRRWFSADQWVRPALALLALVVIGQGAWLLSQPGREDDVRWREAAVNPPSAHASDPARELVLFWKSGAGAEEATQLLRAVRAEVAAGPDARGAYVLRVADPASVRARLAASPLVESVAAP